MSNKRLRFAEEDVRKVARALAERRKYSPVREYLERLTHDGTDVIAGLGRALGLDEQTQGLEYEFLRRWLVAAVARIFEPGCQVDTMLVLQGEEGEHKSRLFEELGGKWYVATSAELGTINAVETMRRGWIIELDEMDAVARTREFSSVKAFITRATDVYVPKYIREAVTVKRASVLGGTVNHQEFLVDEDGLRRFWVIGVRSVIDREWIREHRDGLWAQAVALYRAKQQWHLEPALEQLRRESNKQFIVEDPWSSAVRRYVEDNAIEDFFQPDIVLGDCFKLQPKEIDLGSKKRVARVLRNLGFISEIRSEGRHGRVRGWARPKGATS
jgi:putative DNA primase/helicase